VPRKGEEQEVKAEVEGYIASVLTNLATDKRPLSVAAVARFFKRSRQTYYKYDLDERLAAVSAERARVQRRRPRSATVQLLQEKLDATRREAADWKAKYERVLEKLVLVEHALLNHRTIDLDRIYQRGMPKPDRGEPA
jgi:hypothetical protein